MYNSIKQSFEAYCIPKANFSWFISDGVANMRGVNKGLPTLLKIIKSFVTFVANTT